MENLFIGLAILAAFSGVLAVAAILKRDEPVKESPFAVSTEGEQRCPKCGMGNLVGDARCISCGTKLPG